MLTTNMIEEIGAAFTHLFEDMVPNQLVWLDYLLAGWLADMLWSLPQLVYMYSHSTVASLCNIVNRSLIVNEV